MQQAYKQMINYKQSINLLLWHSKKRSLTQRPEFQKMSIKQVEKQSKNTPRDTTKKTCSHYTETNKHNSLKSLTILHHTSILSNLKTNAI